MLNNFLTQKIYNFLKSKPNILAIYLYGSKTKNTDNFKSDLDMALVIDGKTSSYHEFYEICQELSDILIKEVRLKEKIDFRPIFLDYTENPSTEKSPLFNFEVIKPNHLVYQRDPKKVAQFEILTFRFFRDHQRIQRIKYLYLDKLVKGQTYGYSGN